ncbi:MULTISPECIES: SulP family inorganic anion transporter [unclassified Neisseria]|uniref:SulP family inorganic anion transporter n=1 Tax=unclassified Neisseria TaxID=2623750 RepID=UPI002666D2BC|nr:MULTISPECIES: SulP family inorganic anion transporter [unclassified Neisseria]MDO1510724.1 SulP family inorganic anion transporter [Neisseria sp. MVDL19-042950]MDO1517014.1 SulP family inorganic anion transporter [Neisseria sp. MVDL18-041461]MDO1564376.1 SulP family inorganic anion transporter [Neisseria sp. MVDL20-010259]
MDSINKQGAGGLLKSNFASGLVVFLVALPLCMGIALASGAPPLSGIISGIVGGIVVGFLSTSHISVSGPAAGLAAIILAAVTQLGSFELFLCAALVAGILQLALGFLRAGSIAEYIPASVIEGMLAGIGIIIIAKQLPYALGTGGSITDADIFSNIHMGSLLVAAVSMAILIGWDSVSALKKIKVLPAALIAVAAGIVMNQIFIATGSSLAIPAGQLVQLPIPQTAAEFANLITFPDFSGFTNSYVWITGITIAIVASIETLLCIEASDRLDTRRRITDTNQELRAQGIGNIACALIGGLPMTSVIVRSSANADAGATHKLSAIIHGVLLLVCVLAIPVVLNKIPLATLAAVLLLVGYKLAKPATIMHFWHKGLYQFIPFIATMIAVVSLDLLKGVGIGLAISVFFILQANMKRAYYLNREELANAEEITLDLAEEVSFLNKAAIKKTLKNVRPHSKITINAERSSYIASDVLELIEDFANIFAKEHDIDVILKGFKPQYDEEGSNYHSHVRVAHRSTI